MLQLQRVGVSRLREPAADREGERDAEDGRVSVWACVHERPRRWYTRPCSRVRETEGREILAGYSSEGVHAQVRAHAREYIRDTFVSLLAPFARATRARMDPMGIPAWK